MSSKRPIPLVLISMDGVGVAPPGPGNAVTLANTNNLDKYWPRFAHGIIQSSGLFVGLPNGTDGNSEVGHMTMGAGKVVLQDKPRIDNAIKNETFNQNPLLLEAVAHAKKNNSGLHVMGLVGTGDVHSSMDHFYALIDMLSKQNLDPDKIYIHAFTDGRDSAIDAGIDVLERIELYCLQRKCGRIVSIIGRAYAMDRNRNWKRTQKAYDLIVNKQGKVVNDWKVELKESYKNQVFDEYINPTLVVNRKDTEPVSVKDGDAVIFFNFRPDRALQLTMAFEREDFPYWNRPLINNLYFVGMTDYGKGHPKKVAFPAEDIDRPIGKVLAENGLKQLRIAESEKFPHVTYFFNGGSGNVTESETWVEVPSPKDVASYDLKPEMSQEWVTDILLEKIDENIYDFILVNFAGPDMVGHTGNIEATIKSMEVCDRCIGRIVDKTLEKGGAVVITADHGNAEEMINLQNGEPDTKHSTNPIPMLVISNEIGQRELPMGGLADVAPTILALLGIPVPPEMTGRSLV